MRVLPFFILLATISPAIAADSAVRVLPSEIALQGREARQKLIAERVVDGRFIGQEVGDWTSSNPQVATIENGVVVPKSNGSATINFKANGLQSTAQLTVKDFEQPHEWSFRNHVEAVLAKTGCNSGACHGTLAGKGGFRLSLRGYDPLTDFANIVKQQRGRRIELADPAQSLVLTKPTGALPHKGGLRFDTDSIDYRVISEWIAAGAKPPAANDARVDRLEILPEQVQLATGQNQELIVRAHYSDGHAEDVTRWVKFTSAEVGSVPIVSMKARRMNS